MSDRIAIAGFVTFCRCVWRPPPDVDALPRWLIVIKQDDRTAVRWLTSAPRYAVGERVEGTARPLAIADPISCEEGMVRGVPYRHTRPNSYTVTNLRTRYRKVPRTPAGQPVSERANETNFNEVFCIESPGTRVAYSGA